MFAFLYKLTTISSFTFCLDTKSKQKGQGYARFAQKNWRSSTQIAQTRSLLSSKTSNKDDFSVASLVFWLTGQCRSNLHEQDA
jgi:hypothetical protein